MFLIFLIVVPAFLNAQVFTRDKIDSASNRLRNQLVNRHTCLDKLILPLTTILYAERSDFDEMCSGLPTYFNDCQEQFNNECITRNCQLDLMLQWIKAFNTAGNTYVCLATGYDFLNATQNNGGKACAQKAQPSLMEDLIEVYSDLWFGTSINCTYMADGLSDILDDMDKCDNKGIRNQTVHYFDTVVNMSPCKGQIHFDNASIQTVGNIALTILSMTISFLVILGH